MSYGKYKIEDTRIKIRDVTIEMEKLNGGALYKRVGPGNENKELVIRSTSGSLILNPIPAIFTPQKITDFICVHMNTPIVLEPNGNHSVYFSTPVEIGVFLIGKKDVEMVDVFTLEQAKYTLYGPIEKGVICRHHRSDVHAEDFDEDPFTRAVGLLHLRNKYKEWVTISKVVLDSMGMLLFLDENRVRIADSYMEVTDKDLANTWMSERSPGEGFKRSILIRQLVSKAVQSKKVFDRKKFTMWWGYA